MAASVSSVNTRLVIQAHPGTDGIQGRRIQRLICDRKVKGWSRLQAHNWF